MTKLVWSDEAEQNLHTIRDFIARDSLARALRFVEDIKRQTERLKRFPYSGRVVPELSDQLGPPREILIGTYRIIYHVRPKHIEIVTVFHGMRKLH